MDDLAPGPPVPAGSTLGVEEEFHLVDPETFRLAPSPGLAAAALAGEFGARVHPEITTTQLETATGVCRTLTEVRDELAATRAEARAAAAGAGVVLLPASTHPFAGWREQVITPGPRYEAMVERWAGLAQRQDICGCHVHVGVPDLDTAVAVLDRVRPYLPVLLAMTGSSPFHDGADTGYESYRTLQWGRWPHTGIPELQGSADRFRAVVTGLVAAGVIGDASHLYWDVRPSSHLPTLEFRLADVCTDVDDVVLHAALVRSLVRVLAARAERDEPVPEVRTELLRAARWRAARDGLGGQLFDPVTGALVDGRTAVAGLLAELADDLADAGEEDDVRALVRQLLGRGTSATRQRATFRRTGDLREVAATIVREGSAHG
ncbi:carboxylate-amine ligase [Blastococcus xanthinilyticus]|uniref:Putative glutamate--cysteine ligase 2 n=1 Tax=Blastococcus xanthinilyticus TaxID=1564164 RepID=A0A5S5CPH6_9ACTN|nr:glutamate--cysteine ligase [Blastococcus xanthinilyticus]TYP82875.1 carboxylate-amine ligase [Blastococcus xanthinilyticus]